MNWALFQNSLIVSVLATAGSLAAGVLAALWLGGLGANSRRAVLASAIAALALPPFLVTGSWLHLLGHTGAWRAWFPLEIYSLSGTVWILVLMTWPLTLLLVLADWQRLSASQLESDPALRGWLLIRALLIPVARTGLIQASLLTLVLTLNNFAVPAILQTKVYAAEIWVGFNTTLDYAAAMKVGWPLLLPPLLILICLARRDVEWLGFEGSFPSDVFRRQLGSLWFTIGGIGTVLLLLLSLALPLKELVASERTWVELPGALAAGKGALGNSFLFAAVAATCCIGLGLLMSSWRWPVSFIATFLIPGILIGIVLSFVLNRPGLSFVYQSAAIVVIGLVLRYLVLAWKGARHALRSVDPDLTATSRVNDRAAFVQRLRFVYWPQIGPQIVAAWYIIYLLSLWDVETLIFIIPPGRETLAMRVFNLLHYGHNTQVYALCLILLGLAVAPLLAWQSWRWLRNRGLRTSALAVGAMLALASCSPMASNETAIESKVFSKVQIIGSRGTGVGQFNKPRSLAVDADDNVYVVDMTGRVQKFSSEGTFVCLWQMPQTDKGKPKGMCRDKEGNIIVLEPHYARVNHFSPDGKLLAQWGVYGTNGGELTLPRAAAVTSKGEIFLSEYTRAERVQKFAAEGKGFLLEFGRSGDRPGEFNRPEGLAVDTKDRLYVADSCNHRIQIFSPDGQFVASYGRAGRGPGELSYPYDIQVDRTGRQYVCEFGNSRVQIFDAENRPVESLGLMGSEPGQFSNPWSIALDSKGNLYVADSRNHRLQKFIRRKGEQLANDAARPEKRS
jgi:ABC-type Fe3+ transport system permease subunit/DNA-binding beta-propeller fold protein YncE